MTMELCPDCQVSICGGECLGCRLHKLQNQIEELEAETKKLIATIIWSGKYDTITVKDMREFLQALKEKL